MPRVQTAQERVCEKVGKGTVLDSQGWLILNGNAG